MKNIITITLTRLSKTALVSHITITGKRPIGNGKYRVSTIKMVLDLDTPEGHSKNLETVCDTLAKRLNAYLPLKNPDIIVQSKKHSLFTRGFSQKNLAQFSSSVHKRLT